MIRLIKYLFDLGRLRNEKAALKVEVEFWKEKAVEFHKELLELQRKNNERDK